MYKYTKSIHIINCSQIANSIIIPKYNIYNFIMDFEGLQSSSAAESDPPY